MKYIRWLNNSLIISVVVLILVFLLVIPRVAYCKPILIKGEIRSLSKKASMTATLYGIKKHSSFDTRFKLASIMKTCPSALTVRDIPYTPILARALELQPVVVVTFYCQVFKYKKQFGYFIKFDSWADDEWTESVQEGIIMMAKADQEAKEAKAREDRERKAKERRELNRKAEIKKRYESIMQGEPFFVEGKILCSEIPQNWIKWPKGVSIRGIDNKYAQLITGGKKYGFESFGLFIHAVPYTPVLSKCCKGNNKITAALYCTIYKDEKSTTGYSGEFVSWADETWKKSVEEGANEKEKQIRAMQERSTKLRSGKIGPQTFDDVVLKFEPLNNQQVQYSPPIDGPSRSGQFYIFGNILTNKTKDMYICWSAEHQCGFAFENIKKKFGKLLLNKQVFVVGKYFSNIEITLVSGAFTQIPLLQACYVSDSRPSDMAVTFFTKE